jgi:hypothetical protein
MKKDEQRVFLFLIRAYQRYPQSSFFFFAQSDQTPVVQADPRAGGAIRGECS